MKLSLHALYSDLLHDLAEASPVSFEGHDVHSILHCNPYPGMSAKTFACLHLAKSLLKKFEDGTDADADDRALALFRSANERCRNWALEMETMEDELLVGLFKQQLYRFFNPTALNPLVTGFPQILQSGRTGPGASLMARGGDFYTKLFSSPLTCTSESLYLSYRNYFQGYPDWNGGENLRNNQFGEPVVVAGNRLSFVPKTRYISRVICTEPSLNMFFQLGLGEILVDRLRQFFGIDLSCQQDRNRDLARIGSLNNSLSTIDLSSASDTVGRRMLKEVLPRDVFTWFDFLRSPTVELPDGSVEELHMISSMGNGFTFALETVIFSCIVSAAYAASDRRLIRPQAEQLGNFGVFGDDIIVETEMHRKTVRLLGLLGFTVNAEKSFRDGPFRESCGGDYFNGHSVRGVYLKSLRTQGSRYVAINRLNEWSAVTNIPLRKTIRRLLKSVRYLPVPLYEADDAGIRVPFELVSDYQLDKDTSAIKYRRWESVPTVIKIEDGGFRLPRGARKRFYNAQGLLLAFLHGDIKDNTLSIRHGAQRYRMKEAITPNWDWLPTIGKKPPVFVPRSDARLTSYEIEPNTGKLFPIGQARLASAISLNLNS